LVEFSDDLRLEVVMTTGQRSDLVFEFLHGFRPHTAGVGGEHKSQEGVTLSKGSDASFLLTQLEADGGQNLLDGSQRAFRLGIGLAEDNEVVSVADEVEALRMQLPIQMIEDNVSQQGRNDAPLRSADRGRFKDTVLHHTRPEKFLDKTKYIAVGDFGSDRLQDDLMREVVEEGFDVRVEDDVETRVVKLQHALNGQMAIAVGPEAKGRIVKQGFEDRREEAANHLLSNPIPNGRNAERAELRIVLRNEDPAEREGFEGALL